MQSIKKDNPKIDGIILFKGELKETDFNEISSKRKSYDGKV